MDDTIQEEINSEARVPGELWGGSIQRCLMSVPAAVVGTQTSASHSSPAPCALEPPSQAQPLPQTFLGSGKEGAEGVQTKSPIAQMEKLRPSESRDLPTVTEGANCKTWTTTQAFSLRLHTLQRPLQNLPAFKKSC